MKYKCVSNRGYERLLVEGKKYKVVDIQDGLFAGDYYVIVLGDNDKEASCHHWRFDISKETCEKYVLKHHLDWRKAATFPSKTYEVPNEI